MTSQRREQQRMLEKLKLLIDLAGEIGANDCDRLVMPEAALLHNATQMLVDLEECIALRIGAEGT